MIEQWIAKYFASDRIPEVLKILGEYGAEAWHRDVNRVRRDLVILSRGDTEKLKEWLKIAQWDYRDVLIGEEIDPWLIGELKSPPAP
jgi:hypothetical protein